MPEAAGRIGPNALLQLAPVLEDYGGRGLLDRVFAAARVPGLPSEHGLMDEAPAARVHQALRAHLPDQAAVLAARAGVRTADYILAHRIPKPAQTLLKLSPRWLAARLLTQAIARHAWTFAGSGAFRVASNRPLVFEIADNPMVRGEQAAHPVCHWHAAVFQRLFQVLVDPGTHCAETACAAAGGPVCRFRLDSDSVAVASSVKFS